MAPSQPRNTVRFANGTKKSAYIKCVPQEEVRNSLQEEKERRNKEYVKKRNFDKAAMDLYLGLRFAKLLTNSYLSAGVWCLGELADKLFKAWLGGCSPLSPAMYFSLSPRTGFWHRWRFVFPPSRRPLSYNFAGSIRLTTLPFYSGCLSAVSALRRCCLSPRSDLNPPFTSVVNCTNESEIQCRRANISGWVESPKHTFQAWRGSSLLLLGIKDRGYGSCLCLL